MIELRPHQVEIVEALRASLRKGNRRVVIQAPCSTGKTAVAAWLMQSSMLKGKRSVMLCDRVKLVGQTCKTLDDFGLAGQYSVMMADHELYDPHKLIQVCSTQTAMNRLDSPALAADLFIIDECHVLFKSVRDIMLRWNNSVWVGLSATPMSKGLGAPGLFEDLITTITTPELMDRGWLTRTEYYAGHQIDLSSVRSISVPTGGTDYNPKDLEKALLNDQVLTGDVIKNFKLHAGTDKLGISFSSSIAHSKALAEAMNQAGVAAAHIDGYMDVDERQVLFEAHRAGDIQLLCTSKLLNTGYDEPRIEVLLDLSATRSKIQYCQRAGRIWRIHPGKEKAIYLDFCGNVKRHGFPELICAETLDDGTKRYDEKSLLKKDPDEREAIMQTCPRCGSLYKFRRCGACGFELPSTAKIYHDEQVLSQVKTTQKPKTEWLSELILVEMQRGYKQGWARHTFNAKFGHYPDRNAEPARTASDEVINFVKYQQIRRARGRNTRAA